MSDAERYVLVGVARPRERWSSDLARWSTSGAAPIEFIKCMTADEARAVLGSGRRVSALLLDARGPGIDRDLIADAAAVRAPTIILTDRTVHHDWDALGCSAVLDHSLDLDDLMDSLGRHAEPVDRSRRPGRATLRSGDPTTVGRLISVIGAGGAGTSTVAMAIAQALAGRSTTLVLVDGARRGDLAMYHHIGDVIPGLPELVEAHRSDRLDPTEVRRLTFDVPTRGYSVLLGRRRVADWVTLRRRSVDAALDGLARAYDIVVVDVDADLDGQADTGSPDVEDRHAVTHAAVDAADLVVAVGRPGLHGLHAVTHLLDSLVQHGVPRHRVLPVVVGSPRSPATRSGISAAITRLVDNAGATDDESLQPAMHLRRIRGLDDAHDRVAPLPASVCQPLGRVLGHLLDELDRRPGASVAPEPVRVGELGVDADDGTYRQSDVA